MKKVEAIIAREDLFAVKKAVSEAGGHNICVLEAVGISTADIVEDFEKNGGVEAGMLKVEIFLEDHEAERVSNAISRELGGGDEVNVFLTKAEVAMRFHRSGDDAAR